MTSFVFTRYTDMLGQSDQVLCVKEIALLRVIKIPIWVTYYVHVNILMCGTQHIVNDLGPHASLPFMKWRVADPSGDGGGYRRRKLPVQQYAPPSPRLQRGSHNSTLWGWRSVECLEQSATQAEEESMAKSFRPLTRNKSVYWYLCYCYMKQ